MKNLSDGEIIKSKGRARMKADEQIVRDLIKARDDGTLIKTGDVDDFEIIVSKHDVDFS